MKNTEFIKRVVSSAAAGGMLLFCLPLGAAADGTETVDAVKDDFYSVASERGGKGKGTFYYSPSFFDKSAKELNPQLRTLSYDLAMAVSSGSESGNNASCDDLVRKLGAEASDTVYYDMEGVGNRDTLGVMLTSIYDAKANRLIVTAAVRGTGYGNEWASNLDAGTEGDLRGFSEAARKLTSRIKDYIDNYCGYYNADTDFKLWITGYSRGGGVSDLAGRYINEEPAAYRVSEDDLYVYTFDAPAASSEKTGYKNIHNVYDPNSILNVVFPEGWGIYHSGTAEPLVTDDLMVNLKQLSYEDGGISLADKKYYDENWNEHICDPIRAEDFNKQMIDWLAGVLDRETYDRYYPQISRMTEMYVLRSEAERGKLTGYFTTLIGLAKNDESISGLLLELLMGNHVSPQISEVLLKYADEANADGALTAAELNDLKAAAPEILDLLEKLIIADAENEYVHVLSLIGNIGAIVQRHYAENIMQIVEANDEWHVNDVAVEAGDFYLGETDIEWDKSDLSSLKKYGATARDLEQLAKGYDVVYTTVMSNISDDGDSAKDVSGTLAEYGRVLGMYELTFCRSSDPDGSVQLDDDHVLDTDIDISIYLRDEAADTEESGLRLVVYSDGSFKEYSGRVVKNEYGRELLVTLPMKNARLYLVAAENSGADDSGRTHGLSVARNDGGSPNLGKVPYVRVSVSGSGGSVTPSDGGAAPAGTPAATTAADASPATGKAAGCTLAVISLLGLGYTAVKRRK